MGVAHRATGGWWRRTGPPRATARGARGVGRAAAWAARRDSVQRAVSAAWAARDRSDAAAAGSAPASRLVASHQEVAVWVGDGSAVGAGSALGSPAAASPRPTRSPAGPAARRRRPRIWYSGPCLRGSAYSLGFSVQYVPDVVPYHDAPPQSGSNGSPSAPSYEVEPSVALFGGRSAVPSRSPAADGPAPSAAPAPSAPPAPPGRGRDREPGRVPLPRARRPRSP